MIISLTQKDNLIMGFGKWLLRKGFGSPGSVARLVVNLYKTYEPVGDEEDIYDLIYLDRIMAYRQLDHDTSYLELFHGKIGMLTLDEDLPLFIFGLHCLETKRFRWAISNDNIDDVLEVIREEVEKLDRRLVKLSYSEYKSKAIYFLNLVLEYQHFGNI